MKYRLAIFDFDGTLADSFPFFIRVFDQLADRHGFRRISPDEVPALRHYSARQMMRHVGLPSWKLPLVARSFLALMRAEAAGIALFADVGDVLRELSGAGVKLAIVSSNSEDNITRILGPELTALFGQFECGMSIFGKPSRLRRLLKRAGVAANDALYIGDQLTDLEAAKAARMPFGAVAWGYAALESLQRQSPDEVFERVCDLRRIG